MEIDLKKLYDQDESFSKFVDECTLNVLRESKGFPETLVFMYSAYQSGIDIPTLSTMMLFHDKIQRGIDKYE